MDQLMALAWEFILPMAILNMLVAGVWRFMPGGIVRWLVCAVIIGVSLCVFLSLSLKRKKRLMDPHLSFCRMKNDRRGDQASTFAVPNLAVRVS